DLDEHDARRAEVLLGPVCGDEYLVTTHEYAPSGLLIERRTAGWALRAGQAPVVAVAPRDGKTSAPPDERRAGVRQATPLRRADPGTGDSGGPKIPAGGEFRRTGNPADR